MASQTPVTSSGFYKERDQDGGGYRYYWWANDHVLNSGSHTFRCLSTARLVQSVENLLHLDSPFYLKQLGYTNAQIHTAVRAGELKWERDGSLTPIHGTC